MRILIVSSFYPPRVGGLEVVAEQQAQSVARGGHDVTVLTSVTSPDYRETSTSQGSVPYDCP